MKSGDEVWFVCDYRPLGTPTAWAKRGQRGVVVGNLHSDIWQVDLQSEVGVIGWILAPRSCFKKVPGPHVHQGTEWAPGTFGHNLCNKCGLAYNPKEA